MEHELAKTFWNIICLDTCQASQKYACLNNWEISYWVTTVIRNCFGFALLCFAIDPENATLSTSQMQNYNKSPSGPSRFPAL